MKDIPELIEKPIALNYKVPFPKMLENGVIQICMIGKMDL